MAKKNEEVVSPLRLVSGERKRPTTAAVKSTKPKAKSQVLQIPAELPMCFFDELICYMKPNYALRYVALCWEPSLDRLLMFDGLSVRYTAHDTEYLYLGLVRYEEVAAWLLKNKVCLGFSSTAPRHWMVVDILYRRAYAAPLRIARRWVERQQEPARMPEPLF
jgi:hypothetical protein